MKKKKKGEKERKVQNTQDNLSTTQLTGHSVNATIIAFTKLEKQ